MFFRGNVTEHSRSIPTDHGGTDATGDVVVSWCDVGCQRSQCVKRRFATGFQLFFHIFFDHMHRNVTGTFDHGLDFMLPGDLR